MDKRAARQNLKNARRNLEQLGATEHKAGIRTETDAYLDANDAVIKAEEQAKAAGVPWYQR